MANLYWSWETLPGEDKMFSLVQAASSTLGQFRYQWNKKQPAAQGLSWYFLLGGTCWTWEAEQELIAPHFPSGRNHPGKKGTPDGGEWVGTTLASGEFGERDTLQSVYPNTFWGISDLVFSKYVMEGNQQNQN